MYKKSLINDKTFLSERPGSNWRHSAWKADALPTELLSLIDATNINSFFKSKKQHAKSL